MSIRRKDRGFTLIELIVVIAIIAILAAISTPHAFRALEKAKISKVMQDCKTIEVGAYHMYADTGLWPGSSWSDDSATDILAGASPGDGFVARGSSANMPDTWNGPYIEKWFKNPWGGWYFWDYNDGDQNGDGIGREHVLWVDNGGSVGAYNNAGKRMPLASRNNLDQKLDDGNLHTGRLQVWQGDDTNGNVGFILIQGQ